MTPQILSVLRFPDQFSWYKAMCLYSQIENVVVFPYNIKQFIQNIEGSIILAEPNSSVTFVNFVSRKKVSRDELISWCPELKDTLEGLNVLTTKSTLLHPEWFKPVEERSSYHMTVDRAGTVTDFSAARWSDDGGSTLNGHMFDFVSIDEYGEEYDCYSEYSLDSKYNEIDPDDWMV